MAQFYIYSIKYIYIRYKEYCVSKNTKLKNIK